MSKAMVFKWTLILSNLCFNLSLFWYLYVRISGLSLGQFWKINKCKQPHTEVRFLRILVIQSLNAIVISLCQDYIQKLPKSSEH